MEGNSHGLIATYCPDFGWTNRGNPVKISMRIAVTWA
jgi:hypothetical protein